jgi:hypothetical protein
MKGGVERDGVKRVIKGDKAKEAQRKVKNWLQKINMLN